MIYNRSMVNERYGTCYPFYPVNSTDSIVLCLLNHISSCTLFTPAGMLPPVRISSVSADRSNKQVSIELKDKNNSILGTCTLLSDDLTGNADLQFAIWSPQGILLGYLEVTTPSTFISELMTGLSGELEYHLAAQDLNILPFCIHAIQLPTPAAVHMGSDLPEYTYLGRGLIFHGVSHPGATNDISISIYAETPIGDYKHVPVKSINGVEQLTYNSSGGVTNELVWIDQKNQHQDITVKTYDYILIQGYTEQ